MQTNWQKLTQNIQVRLHQKRTLAQKSASFPREIPQQIFTGLKLIPTWYDKRPSFCRLLSSVGKMPFSGNHYSVGIVASLLFENKSALVEHRTGIFSQMGDSLVHD